jgi:hypothetical protein
MASLIPHVVLAAAVVGSLIGACGGRTADVGSGSSGGSSSGSSGSSGGGWSSGSSGGSSGAPSGSGSTTSTSGSSTGACINVNPSSFDQSCNLSSDCVAIVSGTICTGECLCGGNAAINVSDQSRYFAEVKAVVLGMCGCPAGAPAACSNHTCVACTGRPSDPPECGPTVIGIEAGVAPVCKQTMAGGSSGGPDGGPCTVEANESCSDGTTYNVTCSCPAATCACTQSGPNGGSSGGPFPFSGCADSCGPNTDFHLLYEACGFPLPL